MEQKVVKRHMNQTEIMRIQYKKSLKNDEYQLSLRKILLDKGNIFINKYNYDKYFNKFVKDIDYEIKYLPDGYILTLKKE